MKLTLKTRANKETYTIGHLFIDGEYFCDTLEDTNRGLNDSMSTAEILKKKVKGRTAIPRGTYKVSLTMSPRFKRVMPLLMNVKGFEGVRIHSGNTPDDTEGCILVGLNKIKGQLVESRSTFDRLYRAMAAEVQRGKKVFIEIV